MPTKNRQFLLAAVLILFIAGCATTLEVIDTNTSPLVLQKSQQARLFPSAEVVTFPAGTYMADFKTKDGIYYRAPSKMVRGDIFGAKLPKRGGIFVPLPEDKDQRLGVWFDQEEPGGLLVILGSPTLLRRLNDPIEYEVQKTAK